MVIKTDQDEIVGFRTDASNYKGSCEKVFFPASKQEIVASLYECRQSGIPLTIAGAGTGLTGGRVPESGAVLATSNLNKIYDLDMQQLNITVQAGVLYKDLEEELKNAGLFLPPNPTEKNASIGGNVATNASGSRTFKYGPFRNWIAGINVVLANGDELDLQRGDAVLKNGQLNFASASGTKYGIELKALNYPDVKNASGYLIREGADLIDIIAGSEGTLGVIHQVRLKLLEMPEKVLGLIVFFDEVDNLLDFVSEARKISRKNNVLDYRDMKDISARLIEYFDKNSLQLLKQEYRQIPDKAMGAVWVEQEYSLENEQTVLEKWNDLISDHTTLGDSTWISLDDHDHDRFREFRHALPAKVNEIIVRNNMRKIGSDIAVPESIFNKFYNKVVENLESLNLDYLIWGHFGDCHIHANILPSTETEQKAGLEFLDRCIIDAIEVGGTVSAEHGIGKAKKKYLPLLYGDECINEMKKLKEYLDPGYLLGRGNLF